MVDWAQMLIGGLAMASLAVGWVLWQRLAGRLDAGMRHRAPAGKCSLPDDLDAYERQQCGVCHGRVGRAEGRGSTGTADTAVAHARRQGKERR